MSKFNLIDEPEFEINTQKHGIIKFSMLQAWREDLINKEIVNPEKEKAEKIVLTIAKYIIFNINNKEFITSDSSDELKKINLDFKAEELIDFSNKFLEHNKYLIGISDPDIKIKSGDGKEIKLKDDEELLNHKWPADPIEKIKEAWILEIERQRKWIKNILGFSGSFDIKGISSVIKKQQEILFPLYKNNISIPDYKVNINNNFQRSLKEEFELIQMKQNEKKKIIDNSIITIPDLLKDLIKLEFDINENNNELQKKANEYLENLLLESRKSSSKANLKSNIAIIIAFISIAISVILGFFQINIASKPNSQLENVKKEIIKSNKSLENIKNNTLDLSNDNNFKEMIKLLNEINIELKKKNK